MTSAHQDCGDHTQNEYADGTNNGFVAAKHRYLLLSRLLNMSFFTFGMEGLHGHHYELRHKVGANGFKDYCEINRC